MLLSLDKNTANSIKSAINLFENKNIKNIAYIKSNFGFIIHSILKLENASLSVDESLEIPENTKIKEQMLKCQREIKKHIRKKSRTILCL